MSLRSALALALVATLLPLGSTAGSAEPSPSPKPVVAEGMCPIVHPVRAATASSASPPPLVTPEATQATAPAATAPAGTAEPTLAPKSPPSAPLTSLGGTWRELPRSPFSAANPAAVWAGDRLVVIDHRRGRTATYDPGTRRWEEHERIPGESGAQGWTFDGAPRAVWTGGEVVVIGGRTGPETDWADWYAFDPATGRWRDVAPSPLEWGGHLAWTDDLVLVFGSDRTAAAYDPVADCWLEMPAAPLPELPANARTARVSEWSVRSTHWTGDSLLAVVGRSESLGWTGVVSFDPESWEWTPGSLGPVDGSLVSPVLAGGVLWFMTEDSNDAYGGRYTTNATYDPSTDTWTKLDTGCPVNTRWATWTGRLIMEPYSDRRAFDPATGQCYRTRASKDRARQWEPVWTGREFLYWSGAYGDTAYGRPDGISYRPPRAALETIDSGPVGKKLRKAIAARRFYGLDDDPDVVREIRRASYQPASRQFGFPMTEDEFWDINDRSWFISEIEPVARYVRKLPTFGGIWQDQRAGGRLAIALTEADPEVLATIDGMMPAQPDLGWRLVIVPRTHKELKEAFRRAWKVSRKLDPSAMLWAVSLAERRGLIELMYDPKHVKGMRARKVQLERRLGVPIRIISGVVRDV